MGSRLSRSAVEEAHDRIRPYIRETPTLAVPRAALGLPAGADVHLKLEFLQHSGTFKARGATNFIRSVSIGRDGVVAASGGNHGAAVAWAARERSVRANIFVPTISSPAKVTRLLQYGADVHQVGAVFAEALEASVGFLAERDATSIHAYEDPFVMAGAGTTTLEFAEQVGGLDTVLLACGGGGLAGGAAAVLGESARVVVCEAATTNAFAAAQRAGRPVDVVVSGVTADALGATRLGALAWSELSAVDSVSAIVTDGDVLAARRHIWTEWRIVVEPAVATTVAALMTGAYTPAPDERVGVVLCGANTTFDHFDDPQGLEKTS